MRKIPLFRIELGPLVVKIIERSKELTPEEKKALLDRLILLGGKFLIDPQNRDILVLPKKE